MKKKKELDDLDYKSFKTYVEDCLMLDYPSDYLDELFVYELLRFEIQSRNNILFCMQKSSAFEEHVSSIGGIDSYINHRIKSIPKSSYGVF